MTALLYLLMSYPLSLGGAAVGAKASVSRERGMSKMDEDGALNNRSDSNPANAFGLRAEHIRKPTLFVHR